jgi:hypothetical protein
MIMMGIGFLKDWATDSLQTHGIPWAIRGMGRLTGDKNNEAAKGLGSSGWSGLFPRSVEAVFFHAVTQCAGGDPQAVGGTPFAFDDPVRLIESLLNQCYFTLS